MSALSGVERASMLYWWPRVASLADHIPMPRTEIIEFANLEWLLDEEPREERKAAVAAFSQRVAAACEQVGYPVFLRNDQTAGKHYYKETCFVAADDVLGDRLRAVVMDAFLHDLWPRAVAVRQLIELDSGFTAFWGDLPIAPEVRVFARDGEVICSHYYWPLEAIKRPSASEWREIMALQAEVVEREQGQYLPLAEALSLALSGYAWSLDFARDEQGGWWFIDAAPAEVSFHPGDCALEETKSRGGSANATLFSSTSDCGDSPVGADGGRSGPDVAGDVDSGLA